MYKTSLASFHMLRIRQKENICSEIICILLYYNEISTIRTTIYEKLNNRRQAEICLSIKIFPTVSTFVK